MSTSKKVFATLGISVLALATLSLGHTQTNTDVNPDNQILAHSQDSQGSRGGQGGQGGAIGRGDQGRRGGGQGGSGFLNAADGTTITATFFTADPAQGGSILNSYNLVVGQDSERTFASNVREAMETAAFATITTGPQSRVVEIPQADGDNPRRGNSGNRGLRGVNIRGLDAGSTVQVSFYNGDPAQSGAVISSLSFTQGQSSESAFMEAVQTAMETATFAQINTSQQVQSMDLAARRAEMEARAAERGERGERGKRGQRGPRGQRGGPDGEGNPGGVQGQGDL